MEVYTGPLHQLGYSLKIEDSNGISSYQGDLNRLVEMIQKNKDKLGEVAEAMITDVRSLLRQV